MISSDLLASFAVCLRLSPSKYFDCVVLGFDLYATEPGFGPHNATKSLWTIFRKLFLRFGSNSAKTWPSKVILFVHMINWSTWRAVVRCRENRICNIRHDCDCFDYKILGRVLAFFIRHDKIGIVLKLMTRFNFRVYFWGLYSHKFAWVFIFFHYYYAV